MWRSKDAASDAQLNNVRRFRVKGKSIIECDQQSAIRTDRTKREISHCA